MGLSMFKSKSGTKKILVILAHSSMQRSRTNAQMIKSIGEVPEVTIHNLYEIYPDFIIDVKSEQSLLIQHDIIIWQHPFYWYSAPALLKQWIDVVLEYGFAYGSGHALKGKMILNAITTGGDRKVYQVGGKNNFTINQLLAPFEQTANLCKITYLPPYVIHSAPSLNDAELEVHSNKFCEAVIALRDNKFSTKEIKAKPYYSDLF